jgi:CubicO group peptidase (beta-lactamase class C family)
MFDRAVQVLFGVWVIGLVGYFAFGLDELDHIDNNASRLLALLFGVALVWRFVVRRWWRPLGAADDPTGLALELVRRGGLMGAAVVTLRGDRACGDRACGDRAQWGQAGRSGRRQLGVDRTTRFEIGSVTMLFTALLLADMVVRGEVGLDDHVGRYLPGFVNDPNRQVTLHALATHTSGLPHVPAAARVLRWLARPANPYHGLDRVWLERTIRHAALHDPGVLRYSNIGYMMLGEALSVAVGRPWTRLVDERICAVLGMTATSVRPDAHTARGYNQLDMPTRHWDSSGLPGAGSLYSTTEDLRRFLDAQRDPDTTPLAHAIRLTRTAHFPGVGLGWMLGRDDVAWHTGGTGGFGAVVAVRGRHALAALTNTRHRKVLDTLALRHLNAMG